MLDGRHLPNLVIAGVAKGGTTSLFRYLAQHPDICAASVKEIDHFTPLRNGLQPPPLAEYSRYFSHCRREAYRMEASPTYFYSGPRLVTAMHDTLPGARVLISLRDPVQRLWSAYRFLQSMGRLDKEQSFEDYIAYCDDLERLEKRPTPLSVGNYSRYLGDWFNVFGERLRILFAEQLFSDPPAVIRDLCAWLDLDATAADDIRYTTENPTAQPRSRTLARWAYRAQSTSARVLRGVPALQTTLRSLYRHVNTTAPSGTMDAKTRARLAARYAAGNAQLAEELSRRGYRDLPDWLRIGDP